MNKEKNKIILIGGINSVGVPYTKDNKNHISHFYMVLEHLKKQEKE